jgi:glucoamylase
VRWGRVGIVLGILGLGVLAVSGGDREDPQTPVGLSGLPAPFFGVAVVGSGGQTAAVDAYGNVVDLRVPGPTGEPLVAVSPGRQAADSVAAEEAIVARARLDDGSTPPLWQADSVRQRYLPGTNVLRTVARFGKERAVVVRGAGGGAARADRLWLARAKPLPPGAPRWARDLYRRSLLVLRALTDRRSGAVAAGAREGWAYVWPRDAAAVALAFAAAGYKPEARRIARFLLGLDLTAAARFDGDGTPVPGRAAQGDAGGWVAAAASAAGVRPASPNRRWRWRDRADYQEGDGGDYLGNAIASSASPARIASVFGDRGGLVREAEAADSGFDSAAAWSVRPFPRPTLFPFARRTLRWLTAKAGTRFGIVPAQGWHGGEDPWTAPTAWAAWALAALAREGKGRRAAADRDDALWLMGDLRRAATPLGLLPERVDAQSGRPTSTTPLAWSHAFAILATRELWPETARG